MSWARVDDGLWDHPKFEQLREEKQRDAMSLWLLALSYCGRKQSPRLTTREAAMLLCCDEAEARAACECLRSKGLFDVEFASDCLRSKGSTDAEFASEQNRSFVIHDWSEYRSKDEIRAAAGRKGGVKSGENRRSKNEANAKQPRSNGEAEAKQSRTPDPVSDPVSDSDPSIEKAGSKSLGLQLQELEQRGYPIFGTLSGPAVPMLRQMLPITEQEFADAARGNARSWKYFAKVLTTQREQPTAVNGTHAPPRKRVVSEEIYIDPKELSPQ